MKKLLFSAVGVLSLVLTLSAFRTRGPATIIRSEGSSWFDGAGNEVAVPNDRIQIVLTNNGKGMYNVSAHGQLPDGSVLPKHAMQFTDESTGVFCVTPGDSFKGTTTPSGEFSFTCKGTL